MAQLTGEDILRFIEELNSGNVDSVLRYMDAGYFNYSPPADEPQANEVYFGLLSDLQAAMSDLKVQIDDLRMDGDLYRGTLTLSGTTDGPLWGAPATNKPFSWTVNVALKPRNDRLALNFEDVTLPELINTLRQIDMINPPNMMDKPPTYPIEVPEVILQVLFNGQMAEKECSHLEDIRISETDINVCPQCVEQGDYWPALRMCLICGFVGCCDTSKNTHMKRHFEETGHGIFRSIRLEEGWGWCYHDNAFFSKRRLEKLYHRQG